MSGRSKKAKRSTGPKPVDYLLTPQAVLLKLWGDAERIGLFDRKLESYELQLRSMEPGYAYDTALAKIQSMLGQASLNKNRPISCKSGCSACCHQRVDITSTEAASIMKFVAENQLPINTMQLEKQVSAIKLASFSSLSFEERQCIFLGPDQRCSIYPVRPMVCRRHFVTSDPAICRSEDFSRIELDVNPDVDAYLSAYVTRNLARPLPEHIDEALAQPR